MASDRAALVFSGEPRVGDRFESETRSLTESDISVFAALTGDRHPQHVDAEWARDSVFGEQIAHGLLILSLSFGLVELDPERAVALRGLRDFVFKRPARIGEPIRVKVEITQVRPTGKGLALVGLAWDVIGGGERKLLRGRVEMLWRLDERLRAEACMAEGGCIAGGCFAEGGCAASGGCAAEGPPDGEDVL
jgi:3-hydroxybutyryl-CoA dehydratase